MMPTWQILICTVNDRAQEFELLQNELQSQIDRAGLQDNVWISFCRDNKEMSVGSKRQLLLQSSSADYISFFDDDDWPHAHYIRSIYLGLSLNMPDCIGMVIDMTTNGIKKQRCCHSLKFPQWRNNVEGYDYVRNVTHFNPVKRDLALQAGFRDMRFGEDKDYSDRLTPLCKNEHFISIPLFHYRYSSKQNSNEKYGIVKH